MEEPPASLCHRKRPGGQPPSSPGAQWRRRPLLFPVSDSKAIESCAQTHSARQRAGEGGRSSSSSPQGHSPSASHCPHPPPHERHAGRRTRASRGPGGKRAAQGIAGTLQAKLRVWAMQTTARAPQVPSVTGLTPAATATPQREPWVQRGPHVSLVGTAIPRLRARPRVHPTRPVRISSTPTSGAGGAVAGPGRGAKRPCAQGAARGRQG